MTEPVRRPAVSVVVFRADRVLLVRRGRPPARGQWAPVGGRVEAGEADVAAALRELREEAGVDARLIGESGQREVLAPDDGRDGGATIWDIRVFAAEWLAGEPRPGDDAAEAAFVPWPLDDDRPLVAGAVEQIAAARRLFDGSRSADGVRKP